MKPNLVPYDMLGIAVGWLETNCYFFWDRNTRETMVIDPGGESEKLLSLLHQHRLKVIAIVNTHGHADHISANRPLKAATQALLLIHSADQRMLTDSRQNLSADRLLREGDQLLVGKNSIKVLETPGHTMDSICLVGEDLVFSGDTLFSGSIGRTDFPGGDYHRLRESLLKKILTLPDHFKVFPGHGPATTIGKEKRTNPFLKEFLK